MYVDLLAQHVQLKGSNEYTFWKSQELKETGINSKAKGMTVKLITL